MSTDSGDFDLSLMPQPVRDAVLRLVQALVDVWPTPDTPEHYEAPRSAQRSALRHRIAALCADHPEGLAARQVEHLLNLKSPVGAVLKLMAEDGLLQRVAKGLCTSVKEHTDE